MLRFDPLLVLNASTLQGDFRELYSMSLAFILTKISRKHTRSGVLEFKESLNYTVYRNYCNLFNLTTIFSVRYESSL